MKKNEKGFALALSIIIMSIVVALIVGNYLAISRAQRLASRSNSEINLRMATQALLEKTVSDMNNFSSTHNSLVAPADFAGIETNVKRWFTTVYTSPTRVTQLTIAKLPDDPLNPEPAERSAAFNRYSITAGTEFIPNQTKLTLSEEITLGTESLFNYAAFYEDDMEITPGKKAEFQGPLFSNGDIYLMSAPSTTTVNNSLTLKAPDTGSTFSYIMQSAGHIYGFYKPVIARNYMMDINDYFKAASPAFAEREWKESINKHAEIINNSKPVPLLYYFKNDIFPTDETFYSKKVTGNASRQKPSEIFLSYLDDRNDTKTIQLGFPEISYHDVSWEFLYGNFAQHYHANNSHYLNEEAYEDCPSGQICMNVTPAYKEDSTILGQGDNDILTQAEDAGFGDEENSNLDFVKYTPRTQGGTNEKAGDWALAQQEGQALDGLVADRARDITPKSLSLGSGDPANSHSLIEPLESCAAGDTDCQNRNNAKFRNKADLKILCASTPSDCSSIEFFKNDTKVSPLPSFITIVSMRDDRLRKVYKSVQVDIAGLRTYMNPVGDTTSFPNGAVLYVETLPFKMALSAGSYAPQTAGTDSSIRLVRLVTASRLPTNGLTVATNGRLWIQGDYNTTYTLPPSVTLLSCKGGQADYPVDCMKKLPSSAIFSDSIGVLSTGYNTATWAATASFNSHATATADVNINTAIITGYLASTLERWYPNCDGKDGSGNFSFAGCRGSEAVRGFYPNTFIDRFDSNVTSPWPLGDDNSAKMPWQTSNRYVKYPGQANYKSNYLAARADLPDSGCPAGLNVDGTPVNPSQCDIIRENGIFYLRRSFLLKRYWDDIFMDQAGNPASGIPEVKGFYPLMQHYYANYRHYTNPLVPGQKLSTGFNLLNPPDDIVPEVFSGGRTRDMNMETSAAQVNSNVRNRYYIENKINSGLAQPTELDEEAWEVAGGVSFADILPVIQTVQTDTYGASETPTSTRANQKLLLFTCGAAGEILSNNARNTRSRPTPKITCSGGAAPSFIWVNWADMLAKSADDRKDLFGTIASCDADSPCEGLTTESQIRAVKGINLTVDGVVNRYHVFWRSVTIDFSEIPEDKIPLISTGQSRTEEGEYCGETLSSPVQKTPSEQAEDYNQSGCKPEASMAWPGLSLSSNLYTSHRYPIGVIDEYDYTQPKCATSGESGACTGSAVSNNGKRQIYPFPAPLMDYEPDSDEAGPFPNIFNYQKMDRHVPLYKIHYSGGLANLINLQEKWDSRKFYFSGTLTAPWFSKELWRPNTTHINYRALAYKDYEPAYYDVRDSVGVGIYTAPERNFDYNENLSKSPPPGTPKVYAVGRSRIKTSKQVVP